MLVVVRGEKNQFVRSYNDLFMAETSFYAFLNVWKGCAQKPSLSHSPLMPALPIFLMWPALPIFLMCVM